MESTDMMSSLSMLRQEANQFKLATAVLRTSLEMGKSQDDAKNQLTKSAEEVSKLAVSIAAGLGENLDIQG